MKTFAKLLLGLVVFISSICTLSVSKTEAATTFKDISTSHRSYEEITFLAQGKITSGDENGYFKPMQNVTRAEFAAMVGRALNLDGTKKKTKFKDVGAGNFASGYIQSAVDQKIISGYSDGTFKPNGLVTRGEMAIMICRAFGYEFNNSISGAAKAITSRGIDTMQADGTFAAERKAVREETAVFIARAIDYTLRLNNPQISFKGEKYVNSSTLNVRKGPSTNYSVVGKLKYDDKVKLGYQVGDWTLIKSNDNLIGFVSSAYLTSSNPSSSGENPGNTNGGKSLASQVLVIDPGHGGSDSGATGFGLKEKDVVLDTALRLKKLLVQTPLQVKYTRETDVFYTPNQRPVMAANWKGNTFVSIHANAFNQSANGTETYYWGGRRASNPHVSDSKLLAESIHKRLVKAMGTKDRKVKPGNYAVLRENTMPAVLAELAFIDQKSDNDKLKNPVYRQKAAEAIYLGLLDYYKAKGFDVAKYYDVV
ncbi:N-acetylmuramoyl-L-alanine amidase [Bacillus sp. JJ722]|uniref:N-acetylmuramoyl-L-alanine amidase n=1 Tax=Bacillus sp. JJ722 TaxID=3122973 RepID=UPI002FFDDAC7